MRVEMLMIVVAGLAGMLGAAELKVEKLGETIWRVRLKRDGAPLRLTSLRVVR